MANSNNSNTIAINWYDAAVRSIEANHVETRECAADVVEHLSILILQRLPKGLASSLVSSLPDTLGDQERRRLLSCVDRGSADRVARDLRLPEAGDASIGYPDFVEHVVHAVCDSGERTLDDSTARRIADTFLWSFAGELPPEMKEHLLATLPAELRHRMNLLTSTAGEARVA